ncbi:hypothetical protein RMN57_11360 [Kitasatospora sp. CM 4170]|uniref:Uncharacterized protein n=1 Tax=Kitasatospora aburaviensis TaxID=67265 RepID=A0ABW1EQ32_9ACTN|nr:hypothetical protein [Kitasatospora sp. CM 4170]WNM45268.1 hypothetical protein RMN57_11360 [Kitasatospora sp. CM 4170]
MATSSSGGPGGEAAPGGPGGGGESFGRRAWGYLESTRNLVGCAAGVGGLGLHFAGFGGALWPGIVAALYGAGVLLWPSGGKADPPDGGLRAGGGSGAAGGAGAVGAGGSAGAGRPAGGAGSPVPSGGQAAPVGHRTTPPPAAAPRPAWPELEELAGYLGGVPLPPSARLDGLLAGLLTRLREVGREPAAELIVARRLPVAVDGYLRARSWDRWTAADADPGAELALEVELMAASLGA